MITEVMYSFRFVGSSHIDSCTNEFHDRGNYIGRQRMIESENRTEYKIELTPY